MTVHLGDLPDLLTVDEAAAVLRIGRNQCYAAVSRGEIPSLRLGRSIRIPRHQLAAMLTAPSNADNPASTSGVAATKSHHHDPEPPCHTIPHPRSPSA